MSYKIAGIDVHKKVLMVVVMDAHAPADEPERRRFATMPSDLRRLLSWLQEKEVKEAVMESTAQYWRSVWLELEPYMRLQLAQAFSNRAPRGRKHDFKDAERLVRRLIADELILSFVPKGEQRTWRNMTRMKTQLTRDRVRLQSRRLLPRLGYQSAIWAIAHRLCRVLWKILHEGFDLSSKARNLIPRLRSNARILARALRKLGYNVAISPMNSPTAESATPTQ
jgi:hypothetical protein